MKVQTGLLIAGFKIILKCKLGTSAQRAGKKEPVSFPTDTVQYKKCLIEFWIKYKPEGCCNRK
jgi:hypothetical protein